MKEGVSECATQLECECVCSWVTDVPELISEVIELG